MGVEPMIPFFDVARLCLSYLLLIYVSQTEEKCAKVNISSNNIHIIILRSYCYLTIAVVLISHFNIKELKEILAFYHQYINLSLLCLVVIPTLFYYVRNLGNNIEKCEELNHNIKYLHEFWRFYSLINMIFLMFIIFGVISLAVSLLNLPKHVVGQKNLNDFFNNSSKEKRHTKNKSVKSKK